MSLTENWKEGKIEDGFYYVLTTESDDSAIVEAQCGDLLVDIPEMIVEVLVPVPSYEELQELKEKLHRFEQAYDLDTGFLERQVDELKDKMRSLEKENEELKHFDGKGVCLENEVSRLKVAQLKELLKECKRFIYFPKDTKEAICLCVRINDAIGESEE